MVLHEPAQISFSSGQLLLMDVSKKPRQVTEEGLTGQQPGQETNIRFCPSQALQIPANTSEWNASDELAFLDVMAIHKEQAGRRC